MKGKFKYLRIIMALALCFLMMCIPLNSVSECESHSWKDGKPATCAEAGNRICTVCGNTEEIPMISHSWKHGKDASCTENGNSICTVCGAIDIIPALGHEWKEGAGSSCTKDGNRLCVVCGEVEIIPASGHSYTRYTVEATTTTQGYTRNTCRNCGYVYYSNYTPVIVPDSAIDVDALAYGGIVTDKEDMPVEYTEEVNEAGMLTIVSDLSENDEKAVRKLHLSSTLIEQLKADGIVTVRFENAALAVEFELTVFDGKLAQDIYKDVDGAEGFIVIIDPEKLDDLKPYVEFYLMRDPVDIFLSKAIENYRVFENGDPI